MTATGIVDATGMGSASARRPLIDAFMPVFDVVERRRADAERP